MVDVKGLIVLLVGILCLLCYSKSFSLLGQKRETIVNEPVSQTITEKPRLQDDFYDSVNFDYLSTYRIDEDEISDSFLFDDEIIKRERNAIIQDFLDGTVPSENKEKMEIVYNYLINNDDPRNKEEIQTYIDRINNTSNIKEYVDCCIDINNELSTDILFNNGAVINVLNINDIGFGFKIPTDAFGVAISDYKGQEASFNKSTNKEYLVRILKLYGYNPNDAVTMVDNSTSVYVELSRFAENYSNMSQLKRSKDFKNYDINELSTLMPNIPFDRILSYYGDFYQKGDSIKLESYNVLKSTSDYLKKKNLSKLKDYAIVKVIGAYFQFLGDDYYKIYDEMTKEYSFIGKEKSRKEKAYDYIYYLFYDSIVEEFEKRNLSDKEKELYYDIIDDEIAMYIKRIQNEEWLTFETKQNAVAKMENMKVRVGLGDGYPKVENSYELSKNKCFIENMQTVRKQIFNEAVRQELSGNISYVYSSAGASMDQLVANAFYNPYDNSINILLGIINCFDNKFDITDENLEANYYELLGSVGFVIGHELSHSIDNSGAMFDKDGNFVNWWTEEDKYNFNMLLHKVVKYYDEFNQLGELTLGENIADLGGMSIIVELAEEKGAQNEDFTKMFESTAKSFAGQNDSIYSHYLLENDVHSPFKNRINAVLSSTEKFYEVYNISSFDQMYIEEENRVKVW